MSMITFLPILTVNIYIREQALQFIRCLFTSSTEPHASGLQTWCELICATILFTKITHAILFRLGSGAGQDLLPIHSRPRWLRKKQFRKRVILFTLLLAVILCSNVHLPNNEPNTKIKCAETPKITFDERVSNHLPTKYLSADVRGLAKSASLPEVDGFRSEDNHPPYGNNVCHMQVFYRRQFIGDRTVDCDMSRSAMRMTNYIDQDNLPVCFSSSLIALCFLPKSVDFSTKMSIRQLIFSVQNWCMRHIYTTVFFTGVVIMVLATANMVPDQAWHGYGGHHHNHHHHHHRGHHGHHGGHNHGNYQHRKPGGHGYSTSKIPPAWNPADEKEYSYYEWQSDVMYWSMSCELQVDQMASAVVLQLDGGARKLARQIDPVTLQQGGDIIQNGMQVRVTGLLFLLHQLSKRYAPLDEEMNIRAVSELMHFRRGQNESIDEFLTRFETIRYQAGENGFEMNVSAMAWHMLQAMHLSPETWQRFLEPFNGLLPNNEEQFSELFRRIRRSGHIREAHPWNIAGQHGQGQFALMMPNDGAPVPQAGAMYPIFTFDGDGQAQQMYPAGPAGPVPTDGEM